MKKLLVTGGAGFLGFHICNKLTQFYDEITIIDIDKFIESDFPPNIKYKKLDIRNRKEIFDIIKQNNFSAIIHGAAALPLYKPNVIKQVNVDGTRNILDASIKNNVDRVVFISSTAVYGVPKKHPIYEKDKRVGVGPYGETKIAAEKLCESYRKKGLCVPIIRPKTFIGTTRLGVFQILYDWVESGKKIPIIGNGKNRYQLLEVEDLVDAIYLTLTKSKIKSNHTFNVGAERFNTVNEDVLALCNYSKSGAKVLPVPSFIVKPALITLEKMKLSPLYKWVYGTADKDSFVSIDKIKSQLGWAPKYSNAEALIRSYQWYIDHKSELTGTGVTHRVAWSQGALALVKKFM